MLYVYNGNLTNLIFSWIFVSEHGNQNDLEVTLTVQLQQKGHTGTENCIFILAVFEISALSLIFSHQVKLVYDLVVYLSQCILECNMFQN